MRRRRARCCRSPPRSDGGRLVDQQRGSRRIGSGQVRRRCAPKDRWSEVVRFCEARELERGADRWRSAAPPCTEPARQDGWRLLAIAVSATTVPAEGELTEQRMFGRGWAAPSATRHASAASHVSASMTMARVGASRPVIRLTMCSAGAVGPSGRDLALGDAAIDVRPT